MVSHCGSVLVIEFLASIEPASIPLLAVLAFSLSLYPLGFMLGSSCSSCCGCDYCESGSLPDTVTVTFSGYPDTADPVQALVIAFQACNGYGAAATAYAPDDPSPPGPITQVILTDGGSGYAQLGREAPTITATAPGGSGADLAVSLDQFVDDCGIPIWYIASITVNDGGTGYTDGDPIAFSVASGDAVVIEAEATISAPGGVIDSVSVWFPGYYWRENPALAPYVDNVEVIVEQPDGYSAGSGAVLQATIDTDTGSPTFGQITGITITNAGDGYTGVAIPEKYCLGHYLNGRSFVLAKDSLWPSGGPSIDGKCGFHTMACQPWGGTWSTIAIQFGFATTTVNGTRRHQFKFPGIPTLASRDAVSLDCESWPIEIWGSDSPNAPAHLLNVKATITAGGSLPEALETPPDGSCGSCCLNTGPVPEEVTVSLENLVLDPVTSPVPDGDYVLSRNQAFESLSAQGLDVDFNQHFTMWVLPTPLIYVFIEPVGKLSAPYHDLPWYPIAWESGYIYLQGPCGDVCNKRCRVRVAVGAPSPRNAQSDPECGGVAFPVCAPAAGPYTLISIDLVPQDYYRATLS